MQCPLISVITPCYNAERYVAQTIESVQNQTYENWEMLIVDDCSTDNSEEIIREYCKKDNRVKYFKLEKNSGSPAEPRNRAIKESKGEYLALLDADDLWKPEKLFSQLTSMQENGFEIVYSNGEIIDENGRFIRGMKKCVSADYEQLLKHNELSCSSVMFKASVIGACLFEKQMMEDYVFWLKVLKKTGVTAWNVNKSLYSYRIVSNSRSRNKIQITKSQWHILRHVENLNLLYSAFCFSHYIFMNLKKYYL